MSAALRRRGERGFFLSAVLVLGVSCLLIALLVSSIAVFQLDAAQHARAKEQALHLAEAAVAQTVNAEWNDLAQNIPYGAPTDGVMFTDPTNAGDYGQTTFDTTSPWGYCTNNCSNSPSGGNSSTGWGGVTVAQNACYIVARGVVGNATVKVEAMLAAPQFQFALSCQGPIAATNALIVKAEPSMGALVNDTGLSNPMAANVGSNTSVAAGSNSLVTGDIVSSGPVNLAAPSMVDGVIRPGTISPPTFNIPSYNNSGANPAALNTTTNPVLVSQNTYHNGPVTINGDLKMQGATLYIEGGPLTINGALDGTGAVIVHGSVTVNGGADLDASNLVALLSSGDVTLTGPSSGQKYFQGLVYCDGAFSASYITIAGAFVSASGVGATATDTGLDLGPNTQVVYVPAAVTVQGGNSIQTLASAEMNTVQSAPLNPDNYNTTTLPNGAPWLPNLLSGSNAQNTILYNAVTAAMGAQPAFQTYLSATTPSTGPDILLSRVIFQSANDNTQPWYAMFVASIEYDSATNRFVAVTPPIITYTELSAAEAQDLSAPVTPISQAQYDAAMAAGPITLAAGFTSAKGPLPGGVPSSQLIALMTQAQQIYMTTANGLLSGTTSSTTATVPNLTLNNFLSNPSPLHLVSWREEP